MNEKFYDLKKNKQDAMINAALKIFARNGYVHASTDVIVKEAGISKGLLFHYFGTKQGLYIFILEYSARYLMMELPQGIDKEEKNLFQLFKAVEQNKLRMLKNYPYLELFLTNSATEQNKDVKAESAEWAERVKEAYRQIYEQADTTGLSEGISKEEIMDIVGLCMEGYKSRKYRSREENPEEILKGFEAYLEIFEKSMSK